MTPLHAGQLSLLRVRAALVAGLLVLAAIFADRVLLQDLDLPFGFVSGGIAVAAALSAILLPKRRYRSWGYRMDEDELHIQHGVWTRTRTVVPFGRVQHIDVAQGPLERSFGVGTLILHTAGTRTSAVALPGLAFEDAGRMRDAIRGKIRQDLV